VDTVLNDQLKYARHLSDNGRYAEAITAFRVLLAHAPESADAWYELGWLLKRQGQAAPALEAYGQALAQGIKAPEEVHLNRAVIQTDLLHDHVAAEASLHRALVCVPHYPPALLNLGNLCEDLGRTEEAAAHYRALIGANPETSVESEWQALGTARLLSLPGPRASDDSLLRRCIEVVGSGNQLTAAVRANLWFAIGHAHEARMNHDDAFQAFAQGNRCSASQGGSYSPRAMEATVDALIRSLASRKPLRRAEVPEVLKPLFICGMFRSGSTLIEQVLAAHPAVMAGGERLFFPALAGGPLAPYPTALARLDDARCVALAEDYLAESAQLGPASRASWMTDKRPDNILLLDLVTRVFPHAKVLLTRRDPIDTGLSVYQQHLEQQQAPYSSDLRAIGHYSGELWRWTRHCAAALGDQLRVFDYDAFVRDPEAELRPLLAWLDLDWDPRCLSFHAHAVSVKTASVHQVRRPLYADSSGRWRVYARHLQPLLEALCEAGLIDADGRRRD